MVAIITHVFSDRKVSSLCASSAYSDNTFKETPENIDGGYKPPASSAKIMAGIPAAVSLDFATSASSRDPYVLTVTKQFIYPVYQRQYKSADTALTKG